MEWRYMQYWPGWLIVLKNSLIKGRVEMSSIYSGDAVKLIQKDLKELARKEGLIIHCRRETYSGGSSIDAWLMSGPNHVMTDTEIQKEGKEYCQVNHYYLNESERYTTYGRNILIKIHNIMRKYHHDNSDPMTDYFECNYYMSISVGKWDKPYQLTGKVQYISSHKTDDILAQILA
jgi:hypothetical protein